MRYLSNAVAGAAGMVILLGAVAATPNATYGQSSKANDAARYSVTTPELGACDTLNVLEGNDLYYHVYAEGVQIYRWNGMAWVFIAPEANLYADADFTGLVGTHYAGPTWESNSGSRVVGSVRDRCTPDATAIPWLKLEAVHTQGPGIFASATYIQRLNTVGGVAPATVGSFTGEEKRVPYTAEYFFYRAND